MSCTMCLYKGGSIRVTKNLTQAQLLTKSATKT